MAIRMHMPPLASVRGQTLLTDTKPYLFRQSPIESQMLDLTLTGGTVAWNQLVENGDFSDGTTKWTQNNGSISASSNVLTYTATTISGSTQGNRVQQSIATLAGHKYHVSFDINPSKLSASAMYVYLGSNSKNFGSPPANQWTHVDVIVSVSTAGAYLRFAFAMVSSEWVANDTVKLRNVNLFDLTQMFGTAIADYVYTLETQTAGSGIAWLKSFGFFTEDYYPYDSGSLLSVKTSAHKTVKNGVEHTYPLSDIELRGIPKLDASNNLYYGGDTYESSGTVTRKMREVEAAVCTSVGTTSAGKKYALVSLGAGHESKAESLDNNFLSDRYQYRINAPQDDGKWFRIISAGLYIFDPRFTDKATAYSILASEKPHFVYELATPTTETADPYTNPQVAGTTEEYIDTRTVPMPVGHSTQYFNMVQKESISMHMPTVTPIKMHMPAV